jgi:hypothetical protein
LGKLEAKLPRSVSDSQIFVLTGVLGANSYFFIDYNYSLSIEPDDAEPDRAEPIPFTLLLPTVSETSACALCHLVPLL